MTAGTPAFTDFRGIQKQEINSNQLSYQNKSWEAVKYKKKQIKREVKGNHARIPNSPTTILNQAVQPGFKKLIFHMRKQ